jgi:TRL-like protein family
MKKRKVLKCDGCGGWCDGQPFHLFVKDGHYQRLCDKCVNGVARLPLERGGYSFFKSYGAAVPLIAFYLVVLFSSCTTVQPIAATGEVDGGKRGTATVVKVCGFVLAGDGSVKTAASNGTIRFVQMVDVRRTSILGLVTLSTTIVTGE